MKTEKVYQVTTEGDCEGRSVSIIAYARGDPIDIKIFYDHQKMYGIKLREINIVNVLSESVGERRSLIEERGKLEERLTEVKDLLKI